MFFVFKIKKRRPLGLGQEYFQCPPTKKKTFSTVRHRQEFRGFLQTFGALKYQIQILRDGGGREVYTQYYPEEECDSDRNVFWKKKSQPLHVTPNI